MPPLCHDGPHHGSLRTHVPRHQAESELLLRSSLGAWENFVRQGLSRRALITTCPLYTVRQLGYGSRQLRSGSQQLGS